MVDVPSPLKCYMNKKAIKVAGPIFYVLWFGRKNLYLYLL